MTLPPLGQDDEGEVPELKESQGVGASQRGGCNHQSASWKKHNYHEIREDMRWIKYFQVSLYFDEYINNLLTLSIVLNHVFIYNTSTRKQTVHNSGGMEFA